MLPAAAYYFAKGMRAPWPAPPAFAIAALGMLVQERDELEHLRRQHREHARGRVLVRDRARARRCSRSARSRTRSTPADGRGCPRCSSRPRSCRTSSSRSSSRVAAVLLWLVRRPHRTWPIAVAVGTVGLGLTAVWSLPLHRGQAMHAEHALREGDLRRQRVRAPSWIILPGPVKHTIDGLVRGVSINRDASGNVSRRRCGCRGGSGRSSGSRSSPPVGTGAARRSCSCWSRSVFGVFFVQWPEHAVWNTRFLPFWLLTWGFVAAMGATELLPDRWRTAESGPSRGSVTATSRTRARRHGPTSRSNESPDVDPELRRKRSRCSPSRRFRAGPPGWEPPNRTSRPERLARRAREISTIALAALVVLASVYGLHRAWMRGDGNPSIAIEGWAAYNYKGYEQQESWPEFDAIMKKMGSLPPGRALWEGGDASVRTARRSRSSCSRTSRTAASARWKVSTSSRRPPPRFTSSP